MPEHGENIMLIFQDGEDTTPEADAATEAPAEEGAATEAPAEEGAAEEKAAE